MAGSTSRATETWVAVNTLKEGAKENRLKKTLVAITKLGKMTDHFTAKGIL